MFDIAPTELLLCAIVALLVIGPKDLPNAMRSVGRWVGRARGMARHFRSGFDAMVREAELEEMEKKWAQENERIMREHPPVQHDASHHKILPESDTASAADIGRAHADGGEEPMRLTEQPEIRTPPTPSGAPLSIEEAPNVPDRDAPDGKATTQPSFGFDADGNR